MSEAHFQPGNSNGSIDYIERISDAMTKLESVYQENKESQKHIYDRVNRLYHILKYPPTILPDGTLINFAPNSEDGQQAQINLNPAAFNQVEKIPKRLYKNGGETKPIKTGKLSPELSLRNANELERKRVENRLNGFNIRTSPAWREICRRFGPSLNQTELLSLAQIIAGQLGLKVDREAKRRKEVLIKWYDENLSAIMEMLPYIVLEDGDGNAVVGEEGRNFSNGMMNNQMMAKNS